MKHRSYKYIVSAAVLAAVACCCAYDFFWAGALKRTLGIGIVAALAMVFSILQFFDIIKGSDPDPREAREMSLYMMYGCALMILADWIHADLAFDHWMLAKLFAIALLTICVLISKPGKKTESAEDD